LKKSAPEKILMVLHYRLQKLERILKFTLREDKFFDEECPKTVVFAYSRKSIALIDKDAPQIMKKLRFISK
jgi:hypothetical protein